jgi:hypothetical protein
MIKLDKTLSFEEAIKDIKTKKKNKHIAVKVNGRRSDSYMALKAMFNGAVIDSYSNKPLNYEGNPMENLKSRISDLKNMFGVEIKSRRAEGKRHVEYWID